MNRTPKTIDNDFGMNDGSFFSVPDDVQEIDTSNDSSSASNAGKKENDSKAPSTSTLMKQKGEYEAEYADDELSSQEITMLFKYNTSRNNHNLDYSPVDEAEGSVTSRDTLCSRSYLQTKESNDTIDSHIPPSRHRRTSSILIEARRFDRLLKSQPRELGAFSDDNLSRNFSEGDDDLHSELLDLSRSEALLRQELELFQHGYHHNSSGSSSGSSEEQFYDASLLMISTHRSPSATPTSQRSRPQQSPTFHMLTPYSSSLSPEKRAENRKDAVTVLSSQRQLGLLGETSLDEVSPMSSSPSELIMSTRDESILSRDATLGDAWTTMLETISPFYVKPLISPTKVSQDPKQLGLQPPPLSPTQQTSQLSSLRPSETDRMRSSPKPRPSPIDVDGHSSLSPNAHAAGQAYSSKPTTPQVTSPRRLQSPKQPSPRTIPSSDKQHGEQQPNQAASPRRLPPPKQPSPRTIPSSEITSPRRFPPPKQPSPRNTPSFEKQPGDNQFQGTSSPRKVQSPMQTSPRTVPRSEMQPGAQQNQNQATSPRRLPLPRQQSPRTISTSEKHLEENQQQATSPLRLPPPKQPSPRTIPSSAKQQEVEHQQVTSPRRLHSPKQPSPRTVQSFETRPGENQEELVDRYHSTESYTAGSQEKKEQTHQAATSTRSQSPKQSSSRPSSSLRVETQRKQQREQHPDRYQSTGSQVQRRSPLGREVLPYDQVSRVQHSITLNQAKSPRSLHSPKQPHQQTSPRFYKPTEPRHRQTPDRYTPASKQTHGENASSKSSIGKPSCQTAEASDKEQQQQSFPRMISSKQQLQVGQYSREKEDEKTGSSTRDPPKEEFQLQRAQLRHVSGSVVSGSRPPPSLAREDERIAQRQLVAPSALRTSRRREPIRRVDWRATQTNTTNGYSAAANVKAAPNTWSDQHTPPRNSTVPNQIQRLGARNSPILMDHSFSRSLSCNSSGSYSPSSRHGSPLSISKGAQMSPSRTLFSAQVTLTPMRAQQRSGQKGTSTLTERTSNRSDYIPDPRELNFNVAESPLTPPRPNSSANAATPRNFPFSNTSFVDPMAETPKIKSSVFKERQRNEKQETSALDAVGSSAGECTMSDEDNLGGTAAYSPRVLKQNRGEDEEKLKTPPSPLLEYAPDSPVDEFSVSNIENDIHVGGFEVSLLPRRPGAGVRDPLVETSVGNIERTTKVLGPSIALQAMRQSTLRISRKRPAPEREGAKNDNLRQIQNSGQSGYAVRDTSTKNTSDYVPSAIHGRQKPQVPLGRLGFSLPPSPTFPPIPPTIDENSYVQSYIPPSNGERSLVPPSSVGHYGVKDNKTQGLAAKEAGVSNTSGEDQRKLCEGSPIPPTHGLDDALCFSGKISALSLAQPSLLYSTQPRSSLSPKGHKQRSVRMFPIMHTSLPNGMEEQSEETLSPGNRQKYYRSPDSEGPTPISHLSKPAFSQPKSAHARLIRKFRLSSDDRKPATPPNSANARLEGNQKSPSYLDRLGISPFPELSPVKSDAGRDLIQTVTDDDDISLNAYVGSSPYSQSAIIPRGPFNDRRISKKGDGMHFDSTTRRRENSPPIFHNQGDTAQVREYRKTDENLKHQRDGDAFTTGERGLYKYAPDDECVDDLCSDLHEVELSPVTPGRNGHVVVTGNHHNANVRGENWIFKGENWKAASKKSQYRGSLRGGPVRISLSEDVSDGMSEISLRMTEVLPENEERRGLTVNKCCLCVCMCFLILGAVTGVTFFVLWNPDHHKQGLLTNDGTSGGNSSEYIDILPSPQPSISPSFSSRPSQSKRPTQQPTLSSRPSSVPSDHPSRLPSPEPSHSPSSAPSSSMRPSSSPTWTPTSEPTTGSPSISPSSSPSRSFMGRARMLAFLINASPESEANLRNESSPQYAAYEWLVGNDYLNSYDEVRVVQRFALSTLYFALNGTSWEQDDLWLSNEHECLWFSRVQDPCGSQRRNLRNHKSSLVFKHLALYLNGLQGTVPLELGLLTNLESIDLSGGTSQVLVGKLRGRLPSELRKLVELKELRLAFNEIEGPVPDFLAHLAQIQVLDLSNNKLEGSLPTFLGGLQELAEIKVAANFLSDSIPETMFSATALKRVELQGNQLIGPIPESLQNLSALQYLNLDDNMLTYLPSEIRYVQSLEYLSINNNRLRGRLTKEVGKLRLLKTLQLSNNTLSGTLPRELQNLESLRDVLDLSHNNFSGYIPPEYSQINNGGLRIMRLNGNRLIGDVPDSFQSLFNLEELRVDENSLEGRVDIWVCVRLIFGEAPLILYADCDDLGCPCCAFCCAEGACTCREVAGAPDWTCP
ncbi:hypothetical protein ACA910_000744 [Epithemia clementina (nom. ined.)]